MQLSQDPVLHTILSRLLVQWFRENQQPAASSEDVGGAAGALAEDEPASVDVTMSRLEANQKALDKIIGKIRAV